MGFRKLLLANQEDTPRCRCDSSDSACRRPTELSK